MNESMILDPHELLHPCPQVERRRGCLLASIGVLGALVASGTALGQSLAQAVDQDVVAWFSTSAVPWTGQTTYSQDGIDAAESGRINGGQGSALETVVTGPIGVGFWWTVSCWPHLDFLRFYIDGTEQARITGSPPWERPGFSVPPGEHTLRWLYSKSTSGRDGLDRGWVDGVVFTQAPLIFSAPTGLSAQPGQDVTFSVFAIGAGPLTYQWFLQDTPLDDATNAQMILTNLRVAQAGDYSVTVSNAFGTVSSRATLVVLPFAEALETTNLIWSTSGDALWTAQGGITHDGVDAAQSGPLSGLFVNSILEAQTPSAGILSFFLKVSSGQFFYWDGLAFQIGEQEMLRATEELDWNQFWFPVPDRQPLRWAFFESLVSSAGENRAWLDEVTFQPVYAPLIHRQPEGGIFPAESLVQLSVGAIGAEPLSYQWYFNNAPLAGDGTNAALSFAQAQTNHTGSYFAVISNAFGVATSAVAVLTIQALGGALDTAGLIWSTNGDAGWVSQTIVTHDGVDAAASEPIGHGQSAALETVVTGPGTLAFWWKVSSEKDFDRLAFYGSWADDGSGRPLPLLHISGETGWEQRSVVVPPGGQGVRWAYEKDATDTAGLDGGWLDEVTFSPLTAPIIIEQPRGQTLPTGADYTLAVTAYGAEPLTYQWQLDGIALPDETNSTLALPALQMAQAGEYRVVVSNAFGMAASDVARIVLLSIAEALDETSLTWSNTLSDPTSSSGLSLWRVDLNLTHDGTDAATLGPLAGSGAILETEVTGPGHVSFWWKVSSHECCEFLVFRIGTEPQAQIKGEVDWQYVTFPVPAGRQTLNWEYSDFVEGIPWNNDRAWIDQVSYVAAETPPLITAQPRHRTVWAGSNLQLIADAAGSPLLSHQWVFNDTTRIDSATNAVLLQTNVQLAQAGRYQAVVSNPFGSVTSATATVTVIDPQPRGPFDTAGEALDVDLAGRFAYVADGPEGMRVFDVSNPAAVTVAGSYDTPGYARSVRVAGTLAYVADSEAGVVILDVSVPANIRLAGRYDTKGVVRAVQAVGTRLFVADGWAGLSVLEVSDPANPRRLGGYRPPGDVFQVQVVGSLAYVASYGSGLHVLDVSDPSAIVSLGFFPAYYAQDLEVTGSRLYLAEAAPEDENEHIRVHVLDVSDVTHVSSLGDVSSRSPGGSVRLRAHGELLFVSKEIGLELFDVSDPARVVSSGSVPASGTLVGLQIRGSRAYLAEGQRGLTILELNGLAPAPPVFEAPRVTADHFAAIIENLDGASEVVLESSTNLAQWQPWQTNIVSGRTVLLSVPLENGGPTRYFRAVRR
ncbi:MAG TPA: hypothetical protein VNU68_21355 [Verrucomicrobiae bacterium]|nr:hypothetical protein [Verrucomicrobiae bacterium]